MASRLPITTAQACQKFYWVEGGGKLEGDWCAYVCASVYVMCVSVDGAVVGGGLIFNGLSPYYFLSGLEVFAFGGILT